MTVKFNTAIQHSKTEIDLIQRMIEAGLHNQMPDRPGVDRNHNLIYVAILQRWSEVNRPFVNVHPAMLDCLKNTSTAIDPASIPASILHRLGAMEVRLPADQPLPSFVMAVVPKDFYAVGKQGLEVMRENPDHTILWHSVPFGKMPNLGPTDDGPVPMEQDESEQMQQSLRISLGLMMLASDPEYFTPILLRKDQQRSLDYDALKRAIDRAKRRGVVGFDVGKDIEVSPHLRRPHFAIRWTGKGRTTPKLVPVKGSIINRKAMTTVPTGYEDSTQ